MIAIEWVPRSVTMVGLHDIEHRAREGASSTLLVPLLSPLIWAKRHVELLHLGALLGSLAELGLALPELVVPHVAVAALVDVGETLVSRGSGEGDISVTAKCTNPKDSPFFIFT